MTLAIATLCNSIAGISVTGLTVKDIDEIKEEFLPRDCPVLYPEPVDFVTNLTADRAAFGVGSGSRWNVEYDLKYTLLYAPIGSGRGMEMISPTVTLAFAIVDAILALSTLSGAVLVTFGGLSMPGPMGDPAGTGFFGVQITLHVLDLVN